MTTKLLTPIQSKIVGVLQEVEFINLDVLCDTLPDHARRHLAMSCKSLTEKGILEFDKESGCWRISPSVDISEDGRKVKIPNAPKTPKFEKEDADTSLTEKEEEVIRDAIEYDEDEQDEYNNNSNPERPPIIGENKMKNKDEIMQNNGYSPKNEMPYENEYQDDTDYRNLERDVNQEMYGNSPEYMSPHSEQRSQRGLRQADLSSPEGVLREILSKYHLNEEFIESMCDYSRYGELSPFELQNYLKTMECRGRSPLKSGEALFIGNLYGKQLLDLQEQENRMNQMQNRNFYPGNQRNQMQPNLQQNPLMMGNNFQQNSEINTLKSELAEMKNLMKEKETENRMVDAINALKESMTPREGDSSLRDEINSLKQALTDERNKSQMDALNSRLDNLNDALKHRSTSYDFKDDYAAMQTEAIKGVSEVLTKSVENKPLQVLGKLAMEIKDEAPEYEIFDNNDKDRVFHEVPDEYCE